MDRRRFLSRATQMGVGLTVGPSLSIGRELEAMSEDLAGPSEDRGVRTANQPFRSLADARDWFAGSLFNFVPTYIAYARFHPYGSGVTRENVLPVLEAMKPGYFMLYGKDEPGFTSWHSSLRSEHPMLDKDLPPFMRELCNETGTKLFIYYAGLEDGVAARRYPDWCLRDSQDHPVKFFTGLFPDKLGVSDNGICPQSAYLDEWAAVHLREVIGMSDPDGFWVDGTWMPPCYCYRCVGRYRRETGFRGDVPEDREWTRYWARVMYEWRSRFLRIVRDLKPTCLCSFGNITVRKEFREDRDWCSGDWYSPNNHRLQQSIAARRYTTTGIPYDVITCDTQMIHSFTKMRARSKTLGRMIQEGAGVLANGGQWCYWTFPMSNGALVPSRMRKAVAAAKWAREREHVVLHNESVRWTAVLDAEPQPGLWGQNVWGAAKALVELHRSPDVIDESSLSEGVPYDLLVVPEQPVLAPEIVEKLEAFVQRGGKLLSTGKSISSPKMQTLLGVKVVELGVVDEAHVFLRGGDPAGVYAPWDKLDLREATELYPLYLSGDGGARDEIKDFTVNYPQFGLVDEEKPAKAGFPGITVRKLGKGAAVHIPADLFPVYWEYGYPELLNLLQEILDFLQPQPLFRTDALSFVEVALRQKGDTLLVHFINGNSGRDLSHVMTHDLFVNDIPPIGPITSRIRCSERPAMATWEPGGNPAEVAWNENELKVVLPRLDIHTCLKVRSWKRSA